MLKYLIAIVLIAASWVGWWLLEEVPLWAPIAVSALAVSIVVVLLIVARFRAAKAARELEAALAQQASQQIDSVRPDLQPELDEIRGEFEKAIGALKSSKLGRGRRDALYVLPWYLIIGPPGAGKTTALRNSGLEFPHLSGGNRGVRGIGGTRNCDWWLTNEAVLLDTAGRWSTQEQDHDEWLGFLGMLRKYRKRKPLNGIIVTLSVVELAEASSEQLSDVAKRMRERIDEAMTELRMTLPVYVMFTKCDLLSGFIETFGNLSKDERGVVWGFTVPLREDGDAATVFEDHFDELVGSLEGYCVGRLDEERRVDKRHRIFGLPQQFKELRRCFRDFVEQLLAENVFSDTPMLRGVYFASGTQEGRPFDLIVQRLAAAYNLRALAEQEHGVEPKGYFLRDLFRKVIFPDKDLALRSESERKRQRRVYYGAVGSVFALAALLLALPAVSWAGNRTMIDQVEEQGEALAMQVQKAKGQTLGPDAYLPVVDQMATLAERRRRGAPMKMRSGLYTGNAMVSPLSELFGQVFRRNVVQPLFEDATARMAEFGRVYNDETNAIPTGAEYSDNVARLRFHLWLSSPRGDDEPPLTDADTADSLATEIAERWMMTQGLVPNEAEDGEVSPAKKVALAYVDLLASGSNLGFRREASAVKAARSALSRLSGVDLVIDGLVRRYQTTAPEVTVRRVVGSGVPALRGRRAVRPAFTKRVWDDHLEALFSGKAEGLVGDMWVLGEYATRSTTDTKVDRKTYLKQLQSRYLERYIDEWREFIRGIQVDPPTETTVALSTLQDLTRGRPTALGRLFIEIDRNVDLREKKSGIVEAAEGAVENAAERAGYGGGEAYLDEKGVYEAFADFVRFGIPEEPQSEGSAPRPTALDVYEEQLLYLRNALQAKIDDPSTSSLSKDLAVARAETTGLISEQDVGWRPAFEAILWPPIEGASMSYSHAVAAVAGRAWCNGVSAPFRQMLRGRYPLGTGSEDVPIADFAAFYRPDDGMLWKFYSEFLEARIPRRGDTFEFATGLGMPASQVHLRSVRRFLNRSWQITQALFPPGSTDPRVDFDVRIRPSPRVAEQILSVGGQTIRYYNGPEQWTRLSWPGDSPGQGASIQIRGDGGMRETISREDDWGLFRLIEEGSSKRVDGRTFTVVWSLRSHGIDVQIDFRTARRVSPFYAQGSRKVVGLLRGPEVDAPREIVTGRKLCGGS